MHCLRFPVFEGTAEVCNHCSIFSLLRELLYRKITGSLSLSDRIPGKPGSWVLSPSQISSNFGGKQTTMGSNSLQSLAGIHVPPWSPGDPKGRHVGSTACSANDLQSLSKVCLGNDKLKAQVDGVTESDSFPLYGFSFNFVCFPHAKFLP